MNRPEPNWALLAKYLSNEATSQEQKQVESWLAADPQNHVKLHELQQAWNQPYFTQAAIDVEESLQRLTQRIHSPASAQKDPFSAKKTTLTLKANRFWLRVAAVILLVIGFTFIAYFYLHTPAPPAWTEHITRPGQQADIRLPDGSMAYLRAGSKIAYPDNFTQQNRQIILSGEAFFEVARDEQSPFTVYTSAVKITVLGTSFHVQEFDSLSAAKVSVATGKVGVKLAAASDKDHPFILLPNEQLTYDRKQRTMKKSFLSQRRVMAMRKGILHFEQTSLTEVARLLERWYGVQIGFEKESIGACRLTAEFDHESLENVLESIRLSMDVNYMVSGKKIFFSGKGC